MLIQTKCESNHGLNAEKWGKEPWIGETCKSYRHELRLNTSRQFRTFHITGIFERKYIRSERQHSLQKRSPFFFLACCRCLHTFKPVLLPAPVSTVFHHSLTVKFSSAHTPERCPSLLTPYLLLHLWPLPALLSPPAWVWLPACPPTAMSVTDYLSTSPLFCWWN